MTAGHQHLHAQGVTAKEPPAVSGQIQETPAAGDEPLVDLSTIPHAYALPGPKKQDVVLESDLQSKHGDTAYASGNVVLTYGDHVLHADSVTFDKVTGEVTIDGHVVITGGENDERIEASHGTYNLRTESGTFYDVHGSVASGRETANTPIQTTTNAGIAMANTSHLAGYENSNPFLFEGKMMVKSGPTDYTIYNGSVTTCLLPHPDWQIYAAKIAMVGGQAKAVNSTFRLLDIPILFLPYVTHPVDSETRQSGLLIPALGYSSASKNTGSKGITIGDQYYVVLGRSADLTLGLLYYSLRGFSENGTFRYKGAGDNYFNAHFSALQDRGFDAPGVNAQGQPATVYNNQGGVDVTASFRRKFSPHIRGVGDAEYLSSYIYREAFTNNFNQAISTDITSILYLTEQKDGYSADARVDRYEGLKVVQTDVNPAEEIKIYHAPSLDVTAIERPVPGTKLLWSFTGSAAGLSRVQPNYHSGGLTQRLDLRPEVSLPFGFEGWHVVASAAARETAYTRSRVPATAEGQTTKELGAALNRADVDLSVDIRPPVLERTFTVPKSWQWLLGSEMRHTIEPEIEYRDVRGVNNFLSVLRFDTTDLVSDTDQLEYGVTQHLYFRPRAAKVMKPKPGCPAKSAVTAVAAEPELVSPVGDGTEDANGIASVSATAPAQPLRTHVHKVDPCAQPAGVPPQKEWFSWQIAQMHFFEPTFGNAVVHGGRNIFESTLNFSGIAFLTDPRSVSPIKSRIRFRASSHTDLEWDIDYDTVANEFRSSNTFVDVHAGKMFGGFSYALLDAPGKTYSEVINYTTNTVTGLTSSNTSNFSQMRFLVGYGQPSDVGLSVAASAGIDLNLGSAQYTTVQTNYNWNCCGLQLEVRSYNLGVIRDEIGYGFNFTLANIGTAGSLRRAESLF
ncbi:MAG: LPS-assembly protein LptD [Acidobacteria bacterium]|nr:LPS-assembly protein LptD [Acidobacteriota bacterium]